MSKIEILAPVGNEEMLRAAVFSGADAVYLGFSGFNARTSANNFNADTLKDAVAFCHARGVAVHVALNRPSVPLQPAVPMRSSVRIWQWQR